MLESAPIPAKFGGSYPDTACKGCGYLSCSCPVEQPKPEAAKEPGGWTFHTCCAGGWRHCWHKNEWHVFQGWSWYATRNAACDCADGRGTIEVEHDTREAAMAWAEAQDAPKLRPGWVADGEHNGRPIFKCYEPCLGLVFWTVTDGSHGWRVFGDRINHFGEDLDAAMQRAEALAAGEP